MDTNTQNPQVLNDQIIDLINETKKISQSIREDREKTMKEVDAIIASVNKSIEQINQSCLEMDQAEKEANDQIVQIALEEAQYMADNE